MKKAILRLSFVLAAMALTVGLQAQDDKPAPSPASKVEQRVGTTDITITYSRPGVKDRTIFGELVAYGKPWRVGANAPTKLEFSKDIKMGGKDIPAGAYTIVAEPGKKEWTLMAYAWDDSARYYTDYAEKDPGATWTLTPVMLKDKVETFRIDVNNIRDYSANINLEWENTRIVIPIEVK